MLTHPHYIINEMSWQVCVLFNNENLHEMHTWKLRLKDYGREFFFCIKGVEQSPFSPIKAVSSIKGYCFLSYIFRNFHTYLSEKMAQIIKEELEIEVKASVEKFYGLWKQKPYQIPGAASAQIQSCELREGQWGIVGSVLYWKYTHTGTPTSNPTNIDIEKILMYF